MTLLELDTAPGLFGVSGFGPNVTWATLDEAARLAGRAMHAYGPNHRVHHDPHTRPDQGWARAAINASQLRAAVTEVIGPAFTAIRTRLVVSAPRTLDPPVGYGFDAPPGSVVAWLALTSAAPSLGGIAVADGSHLGGTGCPACAPRVLYADPGNAVLMDPRLTHAWSANYFGSLPQIALTAVYVPTP
ncbi:hypothetical protein GCM10023205_04950 [Yinghuangia aomiensis]|uniref:Uncharacterized protein n=1 Tax=Yinghuangia aomiensis TaxID=676205 RepID=A0ABP9GM56_9ACTN